MSIKRVLLRIVRLLVYGVIHPIARLFRVEFSSFYRSQKPKLTASYWKAVGARFKQFKWQKSDLLFLLKGVYKVGLVFLLFLTVFYFTVLLGAFGHLPSRHELKAKQNHTASEVYSTDNVLLGRYYLQDRTNIRFENISPAAVDALVATEDVRFYKHSGVDMRSVARVFIKTLLLQNESSGGGSTLSQQLVKNMYPRKDYWFWDMPVNKLREIIIARRLESIYSKEEVLELYLNTVPMGGNLFGIERASRRFFNTSADSLKTEEAAVLIGMLKATTSYNPRLHLDRSRQRRNVVLAQMAKYNYLSPAVADSLQKLPLSLDYRYETHNDGIAPYFREQLRQELVAWCAKQRKKNGQPYNLYTDGLKIHTTIDAKMQVHAERAVRQRMTALQKKFEAHWKGRAPWGNDASVIQNAMLRSDRYRKMKAAGNSEEEIQEAFRKPIPMNVYSWGGKAKREMTPRDSLAYYQRFLNTGLLSIEPTSGYVRAWVGGINHHVFKYDHVRSKRQVGSTFKPFVYAAALEQGLSPCDYFPNELTTYPDYENWSPRNSNNTYGGEYTMRGALAHSVNTISAQLIMQTGVDPVVTLAHRVGIRSDLPEVPAIALGVANLSLYEMVSAYAAFANQGYKVNPVYISKITDRGGKVLLQHHENRDGQRVLSKTNAAIMLHLLKGVVEEGSAARLRTEFGLAMDIAGKTGTTQDQADGWFIGITPELVTGVWVGAESPSVRFRTLALGQGSNTAMPIWGDFIRRVARDPAYKGYYNSKMQPLPPDLLASLSCESFRAAPPEPEGNFFDRIFNNVADKAVKTYEDWKNQRKSRREERREAKKNRKKN